MQGFDSFCAFVSDHKNYKQAHENFANSETFSEQIKQLRFFMKIW
jgi:hypothetical protein